MGFKIYDPAAKQEKVFQVEVQPSTVNKGEVKIIARDENGKVVAELLRLYANGTVRIRSNSARALGFPGGVRGELKLV